MDMDSSRRPFDRSREPAIKKPRLTDELERGPNSSLRPFPQRQVASGVNSLAQSRFRTNDRDSESSESGRGGYQPQPLHQELVHQYKTALAELTFNSKPIITNLTIIAGENLYAAKAIAATVCANILEVPTEQKLPSLYLLDSIVKNIGRDYIKYFAVRLPEVFCNAYRQVDSSVHSSMRHLFGTWKGVFPPQTLQMIEKELGFTPAVNGSSSASTLRSDSQSQRPQHSIHVNPKYLERQRQSGRNIQGSNRDSYSDSVPEKGIDTSYGGNEYGSELSRNSSLGIGRAGGRTSELARDKAWYKAGSNAADIMPVQRNGFSLKRSSSNHEAPKSINLDEHNQPTQSLTSIKSRVLSSSWKNSEEEEYMWDEVNAGLTEHGASNVSSNLSKDCWTADDDNSAVEGHLQSTIREDRDVSTEMKHLPAFGHRPSLSWKSQQQPFDELNHRPCSSEGIGSTLGRLPNIMSSSNVKMGNRPFLSNATLGTAGTLQQQQFHSMGAESPSLQSPFRQRSPSPPVSVHHPRQMRVLAEQDHPQTLKMSQFSGRLRSKDLQDSSSVLLHPHTVQVGNSQRSHQKDLQGPLPSVSTFQPRHHNAASQPQHLGSNTEVSDLKEKIAHSKETSEQSTTSTMLAAVMKSGIFSSGQPGTSFLDRRNLPLKSGVQPTQPSGSSPTTSVSSGPGVASPSQLGPSNDDSSTLPKESRGKVGAPSRLPALPPASSTVSRASAKTSNVTHNKSNPVSNLLNSLVAKGLISAKIDPATEVPAEVLNRLEDQSQSITTSSTLPAVSVTDSATVPVLSTGDDQLAKGSLSQSNPTEIKNLIGFEFKPSVIREFHSPVIRELFYDSPHHCSICGLRLKHQEQLNRHLECHARREREQSDVLKASRRWYLRSSDWVVGEDEISSEYESIDSIELHGNTSERSEEDAKVPSDEDQCLCLLCGELFEDVYCQERDEWMFKGAVYLPVSSNDSEIYINVSSKRGPIVHSWCLTESSISSAPTREQE